MVIILVENLLALSNVRKPTVLTKLIHCNNEEVLDHSLLDEDDALMTADEQNDEIPLEG